MHERALFVEGNYILEEMLSQKRELHHHHLLLKKFRGTVSNVSYPLATSGHGHAHAQQSVFLYLKLSPDSVYEELPAVLSAVNETLAFDFIPHIAYDILHLIIRVEIWDLAWG